MSRERRGKTGNGCGEFLIIKDEKGKRQEGNEAEKRKMHMWEEAE